MIATDTEQLSTIVPEPTTVTLLGLAAFAFIGRRSRRTSLQSIIQPRKRGPDRPRKFPGFI
jgi:hypothetical protein